MAFLDAIARLWRDGSGAPRDEHAVVRRLIARYLDPRAAWDASADRAMRAHTRECDACSAVYGKAVVMHRALVGAEVGAPSGFERERMLEVTLEGVLGPIGAREGSGVGRASRTPMWFGVVVAASLAAIVLVRPFGGPATSVNLFPNDPGYIGVRGSTVPDARAAIGISGVTEAGAEYEIVAAQTNAHIEDYLRVYTTVTDETLRYVFVFAVEGDGTILWYAPDPTDDQHESVPVALGRSVPLGQQSGGGFELKLSGRHHLGSLAIIAVFSAAPIALSTMENAVKVRPAFADLEQWLSSLLEFGGPASGQGGVVQVVTTRIGPGKQPGGSNGL